VLGAAVGVFGATFGVLAVAAGLSVAQACVMSLLVFTGGSQFAAVGIVDGGGSEASAVASGLLLAARNAVYGLPLAEELPTRGRWAPVAAHLTLDETTAMTLAQEDPNQRRHAFFVTGVAVFVFWNLGTLAGAVAGSGIGDPGALGLDAAFPAGFLALLAPLVRERPAAVAALAGAVVAVVAVPFAPAGAPILLAAVGAAIGLGVRR